MNKNELNRMLELVDDKYIAETEPGNNQAENNKNRNKRRMIKAFLSAAAIFLVIGLAYFLIGKPDNRDDVAQDYESLFRKDVEPPAKGSELIAGGSEIYYDTIEKLPELAFDISMFSEGYASLYCDENEIPTNLAISLSNEETGKSLSIISEKNFIFSGMDEETASNRNGVNVFGYESNFSTPDTLTLELCFKLNDRGYTLSSSGMSYEEMVEVLDKILEEGISLETFATGEGIKLNSTEKFLTLEEAKELKTFEGRISDLKSINDMSLQDVFYSLSYENDVIVSEILYMSYSDVVNNNIALEYRKEKVNNINIIKLSELTHASIERHDSSLEGNYTYSFTLDCGNCYIRILGDCTEEELWMFLESINLTGQPDDQGSANQDYESLFAKVESEETRDLMAIGVEDKGGAIYRYNAVKNVSDLPFDTSELHEVSAALYCYEDGTLATLEITLSNEKDGKKLYVIVDGEENEYFKEYSYERTIIRKGVKVDAYEGIFTSDGNRTSLGLGFNLDGRYYRMESRGMSYEEMVKILDGILADGISLEIFDIADATKTETIFEEITREEAEVLESFQGKLPELQNINNMVINKYNYYAELENDVVVKERLDIDYFESQYHGISCSYYTNGEDLTNIIKLSELTPEVVRYNRFEPGVEEINSYIYNVDCGSYYINIWGTCTEEELFIFLDSIK